VDPLTFNDLKNVTPPPPLEFVGHWRGRLYTENELISLAESRNTNPWSLRGYSGIPGQEGWTTIKNDIKEKYGHQRSKKLCWPWVRNGEIIILNNKLKKMDVYPKDIRDIHPKELIKILLYYGVPKDELNDEYWEIFRDLNCNVKLFDRYRNGCLLKSHRFGLWF